jgi:hypothetical protein
MALEFKLAATLYRMHCPDSVELGEYHLGMLRQGRTEFLRQHVAACPHCARELNQLENYLAVLSPDLEYSLVERIKILIARLAPDGFAAGPALAPAFGLRGDVGELLFYEADGAQLTIEVLDDPRQPGKSLLGLIVGIDLAGLQVHLWQEERRVAEAEVDDLGNFVISNLVPGRYELIVSGPAIEIHVQDLAI